MKRKSQIIVFFLFFFFLLCFMLRTTCVSAQSAQTTATTVYFPSYEKAIEDGSWSKYYSVGSVTIQRTKESVSSQEKLYYLIPDRLGSTRVIADPTSSESVYVSYYPFGKLRVNPSARVNPSSVTNLYTGQKLDTDTGLYYYHARYYDPTTAHFISADTVEGPNRYVYAGNNPIMRNDPTGNAAEGGGGKAGNQYLFERSVIVAIYNNDSFENIAPTDPVEISFLLRQELQSTLKINYNLSFVDMGNELRSISSEEVLKDSFSIHYWTFDHNNSVANGNNNFDYKKLYYDLNIAESNADEVWIWTNGVRNATTFEDAYFGDEIPVMGFNNAGWGVDAAMHAYGHRIEKKLYYNPNSTVKEAFANVTGNMEYYAGVPNSLPSGTKCIGSIHFPPNAISHYDYSSQETVDIRGFSYHNCTLWGCNHEGYMNWWFSNIGQYDEFVPELLRKLD